MSIKLDLYHKNLCNTFNHKINRKTWVFLWKFAPFPPHISILILLSPKLIHPSCCIYYQLHSSSCFPPLIMFSSPNSVQIRCLIWLLLQKKYSCQGWLPLPVPIHSLTSGNSNNKYFLSHTHCQAKENLLKIIHKSFAQASGTLILLQITD